VRLSLDAALLLKQRLSAAQAAVAAQAGGGGFGGGGFGFGAAAPAAYAPGRASMQLPHAYQRPPMAAVAMQAAMGSSFYAPPQPQPQHAPPPASAFGGAEAGGGLPPIRERGSLEARIQEEVGRMERHLRASFSAEGGGGGGGNDAALAASSSFFSSAAAPPPVAPARWSGGSGAPGGSAGPASPDRGPSAAF
jgi:hypothetical protein